MRECKRDISGISEGIVYAFATKTQIRNLFEGVESAEALKKWLHNYDSICKIGKTKIIETSVQEKIPTFNICRRNLKR